MTDPFTGVATGYAYNAGGQQTSRSDPDGLTTRTGYDTDGHLESQTTAPTGGGSAVLAFTVGYDKDSRVTSLAQAYPSVGGQSNPGTGTWTYTYTTRGELKTSQFGSGPSPPTPMTVPTTAPASPPAPAHPSPPPTTMPTGSPASGGRPTPGIRRTSSPASARPAPTPTTPGARLTQAVAGSQTVDYAYDALDRTLTSAINGADTTTYSYTGTAQTPSATQVGGQDTVSYTQGAGGLLTQQQSGTTQFAYTDPHGDLAMLTTTTATPTGTLSYDPFGAQTGADSAAIGADAQTSLLGYQTQPTDPTTGLIDMGTRLYDPDEGRFTTIDTQYGTPTDPATLNQYIYAQDSPLVYVDPNGQRPMCNPCSRKENKAVNEAWEAGYAASQGETAAADYFRRQATYFVTHPSPPPPPAAKRPSVPFDLPAFHVAWQNHQRSTLMLNDLLYTYTFDAAGSAGHGPLGFSNDGLEIADTWRGLAGSLTAAADGGLNAGLFDSVVHAEKGPLTSFYYKASVGVAGDGPTYRVSEEYRMGRYAIEFGASLTVAARRHGPPGDPIPPIVVVPLGAKAAARALERVQSEITSEWVGGGFGEPTEDYGN